MSIHFRWMSANYEKPQLVALLVVLVLFIVPNQDCKNKVLWHFSRAHWKITWKHGLASKIRCATSLKAPWVSRKAPPNHTATKSRNEKPLPGCFLFMSQFNGISLLCFMRGGFQLPSLRMRKAAVKTVGTQRNLPVQILRYNCNVNLAESKGGASWERA